MKPPPKRGKKPEKVDFPQVAAFSTWLSTPEKIFS